MDSGNIEKLYRQMYLIRVFEEKLYELFAKGLLFGTTHGYIGQEANAVACCNNLNKEIDIIFSNHRCHGHYIAYTDEILGLMGELMGKEVGMCSGRGGSQHICNKNFYSNGVQGGIVSNAAGMALAEKLKGSDAITVVFIGDGTLGEGEVYEIFNMASLWSIPILFVCENNGYAQSTKVENNLSGTIIKRAEAFGIQANEISSTDVEELDPVFKHAVNYVRKNKRPFFQLINTYRFCSHSKSDDGRDPKEIDKYRPFDPLKITSKKLVKETLDKIHKECSSIIEKAYENSLNSAFPVVNFNEIANY